MNKYNSDKLRLLSLVAIVMVVYIHAGFHERAGELQNMPFNVALQEFVSSGICGVAVPLFFCISGYLFFRRVEDGLRSVFMKMKKRCRTLLIPYVIAALVFPLTICIVSALPFAGGFVHQDEAGSSAQVSVMQWLCGVLFIAEGSVPNAFHLWFLRDLILIVLCAPVLYVCRVKHLNVALLTLLLALHFVVPLSLPQSMFWFVLGSVSGRYMMTHRVCCCWGWMAVFMGFSLWKAIAPQGWMTYAAVPITVAGLIALWGLFDRLAGDNWRLQAHPWIARACTYTFFIYLYHEPSFNVVRKLLAMLFGHTSAGFAASYLLSPLVFVPLMVMVGILFREYLPRVYALCTGGR